MSKVSRSLEALTEQWTIGAIIAAVAFLGMLFFGVISFIVVYLLGALFGWGEGALRFWFEVSALVWVPLGIGGGAHIIRQMLNERHAGRQSPLARS